MKKFLSALLAAVLVFSLSACTTVDPVDTSTPKSEELSKQYDFYEKSVETIQAEMKITPEEADEVFLVLLSVGVDGEATISEAIDKDGTYSAFWVGAYDSCEFDIANGVVSEVRNGDSILYPLDRATATVNKGAVDDVSAMIEALNENSSAADYDAAQTAYDFLTKKLKKKVSKENVELLSSFAVRFNTIENAIDSAIENAGATKDKVTVAGNAESEGESDSIVSIYLKGTDNLTNNMIRGGMLMQASKILEHLQSRSDISRIALFWSFPLVDAFGNTNEETVMKIQLERDTLQNISFDKFDRDNFPVIADDYFEHPALSEK